MAHDFKHLTVRHDGPIEYLTLNRPDVRNAFNDELIAELASWAAVARADLQLRVVILAGAGTVFCAGADAGWMAKMIEHRHDDNLRDAMRTADMFAALDELPAVIIGRIQGAAIGGGAGLAAICDIAVAEESVQFGFTETKLGILPAVIAPYVLAKIGPSAARELFLTGMRFSAARAKEIGLVHAVVPAEELDTKIARYVKEVLSSSPSGVAAAKALIPQVWGRPTAEVLSLTATSIANQRVSAEGQEGLRAFLEKRKPNWVVE